ncbi:coenzyme F420-0:L-glutamate ligase, partial [Patescibacteria group bacterium]|nr:coenzyme F420-0:L-glutamate ligase [Patescibacteria group bacterium]
PLHDYRGTKDLFGREFKVSAANIVDSLAVSSVLVMGEGTERTPLALITDIPFVRFTTRPYNPQNKSDALEIPWQEDLYGPLLKAIKWKSK